ncbi:MULTISPECIES: hypothetical protein [unclassified Streptomyces]|uniref:hypothetical protein n=1 Tax=unclassified Streptomyces TaxID=2593676 RepID=UPI00380FE138
MKTKLRNRVVTLLAATALVGGTSLTLGATNAAAANFTFSKSAVSSSGSFTIAAYNNGTYAGLMEWNADPVDDNPGDAFRVSDWLGDGFGMEARMVDPSTGRSATTRGHDAKYTSGWNSGNLDEGTLVFMQLCAVQGLSEHCSLAYQGHA